jgi:hypothetical protein
MPDGVFVLGRIAAGTIVDDVHFLAPVISRPLSTWRPVFADQPFSAKPAAYRSEKTAGQKNADYKIAQTATAIRRVLSGWRR